MCGTGYFRLQWPLFLTCLKVGMPRCLTKLILFSAWLMTVHFMSAKGGEFLLVVTMGGTLSFLFSFLTESMGQTVMTTASYMIGKGEIHKLNQLMRSAFLFLFLSAAVLMVPSILFPRQVLALFFVQPLSKEHMDLLSTCFFGVWTSFIMHGMSYIFFSFLSAMKDTLFKMVYNLLSGWLLNYFFIVVTLDIWGWHAGKFYFILAFSSLLTTVVYFLRYQTTFTKKQLMSARHEALNV